MSPGSFNTIFIRPLVHGSGTSHDQPVPANGPAPTASVAVVQQAPASPDALPWMLLGVVTVIAITLAVLAVHLESRRN